MMVIRELRVLLNVLCSSSRAEIIFSIWLRLSGPAVHPVLVPADPVVVLVAASPPAALALRSQRFRYWLGLEDFSGPGGA